MFCPSCGKDNNDDRRFCNSCGTNLEIVKQCLASGDASALLQQQFSAAQIEAERKRTQLKSVGFLTMGMGLVYMVTIAIVAEVVRDFSYTAYRVLENLIPFGSLFFIIGIMMMIYGRMMYKNASSVMAQMTVQRPMVVTSQPLPLAPPQPLGQPLFGPQQNAPTATSELNYEKYRYAPPSVTEHTTAELKHPLPVRPKQPE